MKKVALIQCAVLLSACSLIPGYERPAMPVPPAWPNAIPTDSRTELKDGEANWAEVPWKKFFTDATLQDLIQKALENNRDLRVAALNIEVARATYQITEADLLPSLDAGISGTGQRTPLALSQTVPKKAITSHQYNANVGVTAFELDLFGHLRSLDQQALENYLATTEARDATQLALIAEVANAYLTLLGDRNQLALAEKTLATRLKSIELIEQRLALGMSTELDRAQARTAVESARSSRAQYFRLVEQDASTLQLLIGTPINKASLSGELVTLQLAEDMPAGLSSDVLLRRPDIMQAEHALRAANANIGTARAAFFPRISLTGLAGFASPSLSGLFEADARTWSFAPAITLPIFDDGRNHANLSSAKANREITVARYEKAIQIAFREVADCLTARKILLSQIEAQEMLVTAANTSYQLSDARYRQGLDNYLTVLDAERSLYSAQHDLIQMQVQRLSNLVTLYKALGGGRS